MPTPRHEVISHVRTVLELTGPLTAAELLTKMDELSDYKPYLDAPSREVRSSRFRACLRQETERSGQIIKRSDGTFSLPEPLANPKFIEVKVKEREPRGKNYTSVAPLEVIRNRLKLSKAEFSRLLGLSDSTYGQALTAGNIATTTALAAEALMRRQANSDTAFLVRIANGVPKVCIINHVDTITISGKSYLLVPE